MTAAVLLTLSSMAGTMPVPFMATYSATKAFPLYFAESLYGELADTGVDVLAVLEEEDARNRTDAEPRSRRRARGRWPGRRA